MNLGSAFSAIRWTVPAALLLALVALVAVVIMLAQPASAPVSAQGGGESQVSVSNLDESHSQATYCSARADWRCAQGFATGSAANGYTLTSVTAKFVDKAGSPGDVVATLHAAADSSLNDGNRPDTDNGAILATLTSDNPDTAGDYTFTCSGNGYALAANTTYFIQFSSTGGADNDNEFRWKTVLNGFDETLIPSGNGWSFVNWGRDYRGTSWGDVHGLRMKLTVTAVPK